MNKRNKILVGCLALLLVLSVGYALFSETITINGTATAKGSFDVTMTCTGGLDEPFASILADDEVVGSVDNGYENDECSVNDNTVTFKADLLYPSARRAFTIIATNTGTIPMTLDTTNGISTTRKTCADTDGDNVIDGCLDNDNDGYQFATTTAIGFVDVNGTKISANDDAAADFLDENDNVILEPGEALVSVALAYWPANRDEEHYNNVLWESTVSSTFNFEQITSN